MLLPIESFQSIEMIDVVYLTEISRSYQILLVESVFNLVYQDLSEFWINFFVDVDVIHAYARLAAI